MSAARGAAWAGPAAVLAAGGAVLAWSWRRFPDVLVDFGRELYVPWRLAEGEVLYRDVAWFNGPLSPYWNALWFRLFGVGLDTLLVVNLAITAAVALLLHRMLARVADRFAATLGSLVFAGVFAFGQYDVYANYNYLTPYSHEILHGFALGLASIACLGAAERAPRLSLAGAGVALGLCFLTKAETFLAAAAAVAVGLAALARVRGPGRPGAGAWCLFAAGLLLPPLLALGLLALRLPLDVAAPGLVGSWAGLFGSDVSSQFFYRWTLGVMHLETNLLVLGWWSAVWAVALALSVLLARLLHGGDERAGLALLIAAAAGLFWLDPFDRVWWNVVRPLPLVALFLVATSVSRVAREPGSSEARLALVLAVFSLVLLAKIFFAVQVIHYGFILAVPGTLLAVAGLVTWLPRAVARHGGSFFLMRAAGIVWIVFCVAQLFVVMDGRLELRTVRVGHGTDVLYSDVRGSYVNQVLQAIERRLGPDDTLVVLPEGVMLNYLARRRNPTPYINFLPPELEIFGEDAIRRSLEDHPPDFVVLVQRQTPEYGVAPFGRGFGRALHAFVQQNYAPVAQYGAEPIAGRRFGLALLERRDRRDTAAIQSKLREARALDVRQARR